MLGKRLLFILLLLTTVSFSFSQVTFVTSDTTFVGKAKVWYFSNVILVYPDISKNQVRQQADECLSGAFLFRNCVITRRAKNTVVIYDMGYLYKGDDMGMNSYYVPNYFNYSEAWKRKEKKLKFLDGTFEGVIEALYYGFDY